MRKTQLIGIQLYRLQLILCQLVGRSTYCKLLFNILFVTEVNGMESRSPNLAASWSAGAPQASSRSRDHPRPWTSNTETIENRTWSPEQKGRGIDQTDFSYYLKVVFTQFNFFEKSLGMRFANFLNTRNI